MADRGPVGTALRISRVSTPALSNVRTALTSLVAVPLLEVLLIVAISASMGSTDLVATAYAGILVSFGLSIVGGTVAQVTRDRQVGVLQDALGTRFFPFPYWYGKTLVPIVLGAVVAAASCGAVLLIDVDHSTSAFVGAIVLLPVIALGGAMVAVAAATSSIGLSDPYLVSNVTTGLLPITAGVVIPLIAYPVWLKAIAYGLPFTAAVEAMREVGAGTPRWSSVLSLTVRELAICTAWLTIGLSISRSVISALRSGRRREEIW